MPRSNNSRRVRQMPKIYGNLQKNPRFDFQNLAKKILSMFWIGLLFVGGYILLFSPIFKVSKVEVEGINLTDRKKLKNKFR